ncbi:hypothetical protein M5K25_005992 [Dendrobium thyrsiflorum]|uniref:Uncharacterized protein n=1 Tax=Dendrobium thyrsiflorum TaxID=117978 RepID=A0ABD0VHP6_DENTH
MMRTSAGNLGASITGGVRMVGGMMISPIKIPWFRHPGPSWSLVYLVRGGSRPNLTEGSLSAAMGCVVQRYLVDWGGFCALSIISYQFITQIFKAIGELTSSGHDRNLVVPFGGEPPGSEGPGSGGVALCYCLPIALYSHIFCSKISAAPRRRPRVGTASGCVKPSRPPIKAVTKLEREKRERSSLSREKRVGKRGKGGDVHGNHSFSAFSKSFANLNYPLYWELECRSGNRSLEGGTDTRAGGDRYCSGYCFKTRLSLSEDQEHRLNVPKIEL